MFKLLFESYKKIDLYPDIRYWETLSAIPIALGE